MALHPPYPNFVNDFGGSSTVQQSLVPYPQYTYIFNNFEGFGTTYYQSIQIEFDKRFTQRIVLPGWLHAFAPDGQHQQRFLELHHRAASTSTTRSRNGPFPTRMSRKPSRQRNLRAAHRSWQEICQQPHHLATSWAAGRSAGFSTMKMAETSASPERSPFPNGFDRPLRESRPSRSAPLLTSARRTTG